MNLLLVYKAIAAVMAVVLGTAAAGGGVVLASANSLPDEALYPAKLFVEDTRLALTSDPAALADLNLAFTGERTEEMQRLLAQGELVPQDAIERMARHTHQFMEHIAQAQPEEIPGLLERVMTRTRSQMQILSQVGVAVPEDAQDALRHAREVARRAYETAGAAQGDPEQFQKEYKLRHWGSTDPQGPPDEAGPPDDAPRGPSDDAGSPGDTPQGSPDDAPQGPSDGAGPPDDAPRGPSDDAGSPGDTPQGPPNDAPQGQSNSAGPPDDAPRGPSDDAGSPGNTPQGPSDNANPRGSPSSP